MSVKPRSLCRRTLSRGALALVAAGLALSAPAVALAERPTTGPAAPRHERSDRRQERDKGDNREKGEHGGDRGGRSGQRREFKLTDDKWAEVAAFMAANSRNLWALYEKLPERHKTGAREKIARRYFGLKRLKERDEALYEIEIKRMKVEDELFGLVGDIRKTPREEREPKEQQLREKVEELWAVRMEDRKLQLDRIERQLRGFRMEGALAALRKEREKDAADKEQWVESRLEDYHKHVDGHRGRRLAAPERKDERSEDQAHKHGDRDD